jgi:cell division protein FtsL
MTKRSTLAVILVAFTALVGAAAAHVALRMKVVRLGYEISERTRERRALDEEHRRLMLERSMLRDPARIERLAREKLGMRRPDPTQIRIAPPRTEVAQVAPAPAPAPGTRESAAR